MSEEQNKQTEEVVEEQPAQEGEVLEAAPETDDLSALLKAAEAKAEENWEAFVRSKAELQNYQRRAEKDLENAHKYSQEKFAKELLPVLDSLELGLNAAQENAGDVSKLIEGTEMTLKMFQQAFEKLDIAIINPEGEVFNPEFHQAISMQDSEDAKPNTVLNVVQKGYSLSGRLIRPAMVVVAKAAAPKKIDEQA